MAIRTVVTRGFGNGTFNGTIGLVVVRGFAAGAIPPIWTPTSDASDSWAATVAASDIWTPTDDADDIWTS